MLFGGQRFSGGAELLFLPVEQPVEWSPTVPFLLDVGVLELRELVVEALCHGASLATDLNRQPHRTT